MKQRTASGKGRIPSLRAPNPLSAKPPDHDGRFCSRRGETRRGRSLLFWCVVFFAVLTHRKVKCSFGMAFSRKRTFLYSKGAVCTFRISEKSDCCPTAKLRGDGYAVGFFIVREILPFFTSTASTQTVTMSPTLTASSGCFTNLPNCEM